MSAQEQQKPMRLLIPTMVITLLCVGVLFVSHDFTSQGINTNKQKNTLSILNTVLPLNYNNNILEDSVEVPELLTIVYRARQTDSDVGVVYMPVLAKGYNGDITLAIGIDFEGVITGVRVLTHRETEGLGDAIDQNVSDWILGFNTRSLSNSDSKEWALENEGGTIDQISGATISPRAVVRSVKNVLDHYQTHRNELYK